MCVAHLHAPVGLFCVCVCVCTKTRASAFRAVSPDVRASTTRCARCSAAGQAVELCIFIVVDARLRAAQQARACREVDSPVVVGHRARDAFDVVARRALLETEFGAAARAVEHVARRALARLVEVDFRRRRGRIEARHRRRALATARHAGACTRLARRRGQSQSQRLSLSRRPWCVARMCFRCVSGVAWPQ